MKILVLSRVRCEAALRQLGHEVKTCGFVPPSDFTPDHLPCSIHEVLRGLRFEPDVILLGDESLMPQFVGLEFVDVPLVWYAVDAHIHHAWHPDYAALFDAVFVAQKDFVSSYVFDAERQLVEWLPLHCNSRRDRRLDLPRTLAVSFVGTVDPAKIRERAELLDALRPRIPIHVSSGDYVEVFNRSRIVLNQSAIHDLNLRTFEAMACGAMLLQERVRNGLSDLFTDREHLVLYERGDVDEIVEKVRHYLEHEAERAAIAERGHAEVMAKHTDVQRAERIVEVVVNGALGERVRARASGLDRILPRLARVYDYTALIYQGVGRHHHGADRERFGSAAAAYRELAAVIHTRLDPAGKGSAAPDR